MRVYFDPCCIASSTPAVPAGTAKIIAREMVEPTRALDTLLEEVARPLHRELATIVRRLLGSAATDENVRLGALSIMGQCVYYHHARTVLKRLYPEQKYGAEDIARMVDHITKFSLAGMQEFRTEGRDGDEIPSSNR